MVSRRESVSFTRDGEGFMQSEKIFVRNGGSPSVAVRRSPLPALCSSRITVALVVLLTAVLALVAALSVLAPTTYTVNRAAPHYHSRLGANIWRVYFHVAPAVSATLSSTHI